MGEKRRKWKPEEIAAVLRRVLVDKAEVSQVCGEFGCCPSQVFRWQKQLIDGAAKVFERSKADSRRKKAFEEHAARLEATLRQKDAVLAELMAEHVLLKKSSGEA